MDTHSLQVLEYKKVLDKLVAHTTNGVGHEFASQLEPLPYPETVVRRLQETKEGRYLRDHESGLPLGGIHDIRTVLEQGRVEMRISPHDLLKVMYSTEAGRSVRMYILNRHEHVPLLAEMATNIPVLQIVESRIGACISESAEVRDSASPELGRIRSQIKVTQNRLTDRLQSLLGAEKHRTHIQETVVTVREGRYCIPVKAEYAKAFGGIVHDSSQSGATVFIEPPQTIELGNELKQLLLKEVQEIERILSELTALVGSYYAELHRMISILGHLDVINAKAILAEEMQAAEPKLNRKGIVKLYEARHPLLTGHVIPIEVEVGEKFSTLLITGPNTGGKTVSLKTIGLLTLMILTGLQIPASGDSEIALFDQVYADIGDEQDIQQSLSTFSAHLKNIVRIVDTIGTNALVLMDEVGAGTDPAEGAALAKSLLDYLQQKGARVVATTHYGELKEYAYSHTGVENASVEFSLETLSPTYRVMLGVPGSSNAFYIARRLGLREDLVNGARDYLSHRDIETGELLQQIEKSRRAAKTTEIQANRARNEATAAKREYETRVQQITEVQRTVRQNAEEEARLVLRRANEKAENILKELQKLSKGAQKGTTARRKLETLRKETYNSLEEQNPVPLAEPPPAPDGHIYKKGDRVRVVSLNMDGQLLDDPRDGSVILQMGIMRVTLPLNQLRPMDKAETAEIVKREKKKATIEVSGAGDIAMQKSLQISPELMLRAMRADEAQSLLDKYIDDAFVAGLQQARIIHGRGTGALRRVVQDYLRQHPSVASFRQGVEGEGGDGVTVVVFNH
ncbi:MAG: endonuclease MutS2 [Armatimonadetes bacterium]|nr:endonuclease MutS2 [Armatimonadota bacterium]